MATKIENLGRWAEKQFSSLCSEGGVYANKSEEDETGWDFLLEFPLAKKKGVPPDLQKTEATARAQVKSSRRGKLVASLKLSNAHRFATIPEPCFVILAAATNGGHPIQFYAKHFWQEEIERTLKRLREADHKSKPPHKQQIAINFTETDNHTHDLVDWMRKIVADDATEYAVQKQKFNRNIGYEDGHVVGTITFAYSDLQSFVDHSIGLDTQIDVANARLVDRRFGIDAKTPVFDTKPDRVEMRTHPQPCTVEITDSDDRVHSFAGEIFTPGIPGLPLEMVKARIVAGPIEAILHGTGHAKVDYHFNSADMHEIGYLTRCVSLLVGMGKGSIQFSTLLGGSRLDSKPISPTTLEDIEELSAAAALLTTLDEIAGQAEGANPQLSLDAVFQGWDKILDFQGFVAADSMDFSIERENDHTLTTPIRRLVTAMTLSMNDLLFTVVLAYKLKTDEIEGQKRHLVFLKPAIIMALVDQRDAEHHSRESEEAIQRYADRHGEGVITLGQTESKGGYCIWVVNPRT